MKKHWKIFRKNSMEIFRNFPEKYEIFWTNFPPHITTGRPSRQSAGAAKWANPTFNTIRKTVVTRDKYVILSLYKSRVILCTGIESLLATGHCKAGDTAK